MTIALTSLGFDSKGLKSDHDMKDHHFGSLPIRILTLKQFGNWRKLVKNRVLTLSGPAFSVVRQARGGSEAQMPKIKVNIN